MITLYTFVALARNCLVKRLCQDWFTRSPPPPHPTTPNAPLLPNSPPFLAHPGCSLSTQHNDRLTTTNFSTRPSQVPQPNVPS